MSCKLNFTIGAFTQIGFSGCDEVKILLGHALKNLLGSQLVWRKGTIVISFFDEWSGCLDSLNVREKHRISSFWRLTWTFELMSFEPVYLIASLTAIFHGLRVALWTCVKWYELLIKFFAVYRWVIDTVLLIFPDVLQWAFVVFTLAHMDKFIVGWLCVYRNALGCRKPNTTDIPHATGVIKTTLRVETYSRISSYTTHFG